MMKKLVIFLNLIQPFIKIRVKAAITLEIEVLAIKT